MEYIPNRIMNNSPLDNKNMRIKATAVNSSNSNSNRQRKNIQRTTTKTISMECLHCMEFYFIIDIRISI